MNPARRPLVLMILDGWGYRAETDDNAIALAHTPCWDRLWATDPHALIETSGESVGLPAGQMGNSEVGHMNIGAGRIVYQEFTRISHSIDTGEFRSNEVLCSLMDDCKRLGASLHLMGLLSPGGVHSHEEHFSAALQLAADRGVKTIAVHLFLDGRDTPPKSAEASIRAMQEHVGRIPGAAIRSVCGRFYAMDRDRRWERVRPAYEAIALARAEFRSETALAGLESAYLRGESDEFVKPTVIGDPAALAAGDAILFVNFRADRARELTQAFVDPGFNGFPLEQPKLLRFVCMTEYQAGLPVEVAFPTDTVPEQLAEILSRQGLRQLRIAETEKYAHVTFFFNGGREEPFPLEDRQLIPSPKVATYDLQPEMSVPELTTRLALAIRSGHYDVVICNIANPDMVGHTGSLEAAIKAVEAVDRCLLATCAAVDEAGGELLITADHGNVEQMLDPSTGQRHTAHTTNPVPLLFHGRPATMAATGTLRDIAPTMLHLLGLQQPELMTGHNLLTLTASG